MTDAELATAIDTAMAEHLDAAYWGGTAAAQKTAAWRMAKRDVMARLPGQSLDAIGTDGAGENPVVLAIMEQAIYLSRNYAEQTGGKVVTGEGVEGLSVSYTLIGDAAKIGFSARAEAYIAMARRSALARGLRFTRG